MILFKLFFEFFKIGLFSVGGGLATLPFLYDLSDKTKWFTNKELTNMVAISQSTPGPIGVNMASSVGFTTYGIIGAIVATLSLVLPSFLIIIIIAHYLKKFNDNKIVNSAFYGLRPASTALIAAAGYSVIKLSIINIDKYRLTNKILDLFNIKSLIFAVILYYLITKYKKHPALYIGISAIIGIIFKFSS